MGSLVMNSMRMPGVQMQAEDCGFVGSERQHIRTRPAPECCTTFQVGEIEIAAGWSVAKSSR